MMNLLPVAWQPLTTMPTTSPNPDSFDQSVAAALALLVAVAGWYYLFYSKAAQRLSGMEDPGLNNRRVWLRRANGFVMLALAALLYTGFAALDWDRPTMAFLWVWSAVLLLLFVMMVLVMLDLRWTARLRQSRDKSDAT